MKCALLQVLAMLCSLQCHQVWCQIFLMLLAGCILISTGYLAGDVHGMQLPMLSSEDSQDMATASASGKHDIFMIALSSWIKILYICWQGICDLTSVIQPVIAFFSAAAQATAGNSMQTGKSLQCILLLLLSHLRVCFCVKTDIVVLVCSPGSARLATWATGGADCGHH